MGFDAASFVSKISSFRDTMPNVMSPENFKAIQEFADDAAALNAKGAPYAKQAGGQPMAGVTQYAGEAIEQQVERGMASAAKAPGVMGKVGGVVDTMLDWYFKKNAIDRIAIDSEAMAFILTDASLRPMLRDSMKSTLDAYGQKIIAAADGKLLVTIKNRMAKIDPKLFKRVWGGPRKRPTSGLGAVPAAAGSSQWAPVEQDQ